MPPRKRKNEEVFQEESVELSNKNDKNVERKRKVQKKQKSTEVENVSPTKTTEKHAVVKIFVNAQTNEAFHQKYIKELMTQYEVIGHDFFLSMYICCLKQLIEKDEAVAAYANVGLQFMAKFATSLTNESSEDLHKFSETVFDWVLKTVSLSHNIRSRLCKFVNLLLDSLGSNASLDDTLYDNILKYMFDRLKDMYPSVRVQAIKALQRLQMPDDPDDPIVKIYTFHLASDPSGVVRQAVLTCLGRNVHTIPVILERLWDMDDKVRRHVYVHMANYPVKTYKVVHRLTFLEQGLNDRSDSVRRIVTAIMIPQWLESYNKNYLAFLSGLKMDASDAEIDRFRATAVLALNEIFKTQKPENLISALCLDDDENSAYPKCIPFQKLTIESSLFWCSLIAFFQQDERHSDHLELVIPELSTFCGYVEKYNDTTISEEKEPWETIISQGILFNLIEILINFDYGDEVGRKQLRSLAVHLLTTNPCNENIIKSLVKISEKLIPNSDDRLQVYVDVIRSLVDQDLLEKLLNFSDPHFMEAMEKDPNLNLQVSSSKLKLYELKEEESKFVRIKDYSNVSRIAEEIAVCQDRLLSLVRPLITGASTFLQQKRITKELQIKALKLAFHGVCSKSVSKLNPAMSQLYTDFIRLKIESSDMDVRNWALKCGATFSLLYEQLAKDVFTALNKQFFDHHHTDVWTTSVGAMFELIARYGFGYFDEDPNMENGENKQKEKSKRSRLLYNTTEYAEDTEDESSIDKGNLTIKGLIFLFGHFMDTCDDIRLMSALIDGFALLILHGLYVDEKLVSRLILLYFNPTTEPEVNQILSIFFETLIHRKKQDCLEAALIQTLTKIIEASSESPLHEVKIETVLKFIISSTMPLYCKTGAKIHDNVALSLLKWMKDNATNREVLKITSKEILSLEISDDKNIRQTSQDYVDDLLEMPMDSRTQKNLKSFKEKMQGNCPTDIQFSSVAPANGVDGEIDQVDVDGETQSDNDEETEEMSEKSGANGDEGNPPQSENGQEDKRSEISEDVPVAPSENIEESSNEKNCSSTEQSTNKDVTQGNETQNTSAEVATEPIISNENISPSPRKIRKRVRDRVAGQQSQSSPDVSVAAKKIVPPSKPDSKQTVPRKRHSDSLESNQNKGDPDDIQPKTKKSKPEVVSDDVQKKNKNTGKKNVPDSDTQTPVKRPTRQNQSSAVKAAVDKKASQKKSQQKVKVGKTVNKEASPPKSKNKVDQTEKSEKAITSHENARSSNNISATKSPKTPQTPQTPSRPNRRSRKVSQNVDNTSKMATNTPKTTTVNKTSIRQRLITSETRTQKLKSRTESKTVSPKKAPKEKPQQRRSLSTIDNSLTTDSQHRTRRAIAKEFIANNVMTRKRSSTDGVKFLKAIAGRKSLVGVTEKTSSPRKVKKNLEKKSLIPVRQRRPKNLEKK